MRRGYDCSLINVRFVKPLDQETLLESSKGASVDRHHGGKRFAWWFRLCSRQLS